MSIEKNLILEADLGEVRYNTEPMKQEKNPASLFCIIQHLPPTSLSKLIQHHIHLPDTQAFFVGIKVSSGHACQEDFLVVTAGEDFVFADYESAILLHKFVSVCAESF